MTDRRALLKYQASSKVKNGSLGLLTPLVAIIMLAIGVPLAFAALNNRCGSWSVHNSYPCLDFNTGTIEETGHTTYSYNYNELGEIISTNTHINLPTCSGGSQGLIYCEMGWKRVSTLITQSNQ